MIAWKSAPEMTSTNIVNCKLLITRTHTKLVCKVPHRLIIWLSFVKALNLTLHQETIIGIKVREVLTTSFNPTNINISLYRSSLSCSLLVQVEIFLLDARNNVVEFIYA